MRDLLKLNAPDWPLVTTGVIMSAAVGCLFPLMSILFSEMLEVRRTGKVAGREMSLYSECVYVRV